MRINYLRLRAALGLGALLLVFILFPSFIDAPSNIDNPSFNFFDGGDFSLNFAAAAPETYDHDVGGGAFNDGDNGDDKDIREELEAVNYACGDIISYFLKIDVNASATDTNQVLELDFSFLADPTGQPGVAHSEVIAAEVNYGDVENGDDGNPLNPGSGFYGLDSAIDDDRQGLGMGDTGVGGSTVQLISEVFDPAGTVPFGSPTPADALLLKIRVDDLDPDETIVIRIDVKIICNPGSSPTGNLQGRFKDGAVVEANGLPVMPPDATTGGEQTINFKQIGKLFGTGEPLINIQKTVTTQGGSCPGDETLFLTGAANVMYCYAVTNPGTDDLFDVQIVDDNATPGNTGDDFIITLSGLTDIDGEGDLGDLAAGATATGSAVIANSGALGATVNKATATGNNGLDGGLYEDLMDMDIATVVVCDLTCTATDGTVLTNGDFDGVVSAKGFAGTIPYAYSWEDASNPGVVISTNDEVTGLGVGTYNVTVSDALGCTAFCSAEVTVQGVVPVKLADFKAELKGEHVLLTWTTLAEVNNAGFYIEKSLRKNASFGSLGFIKGQNSSRSKKDYKFIDELNPDEKSIYYRLKQMDYDGNTFYSDIRIINRIKDPSNISIFPNPTNGVITVTLPDDGNQSSIRVYNSVGQLISSYNIEAGTNSTQVDLSSQKMGVYMIHVSNDYSNELRKVILNY